MNIHLRLLYATNYSTRMTRWSLGCIVGLTMAHILPAAFKPGGRRVSQGLV